MFDDVVLLDENVGNINVQSKNQLIFTKTQRGCPKLCKIGYYYTIDGPAKSMGYKGKITWKCERTGNRSVPKCPGRDIQLVYSNP